MYVDQGEDTLANLLPELVGSVPDETWYRVLFCLADIKQSWDLIGDAAQMKARLYVENASEDDLFKILPYAVKVAALRDIAIKRLPQASAETFAKVLRVDPSEVYLDQALTRFENATSFRKAESLLEQLVLPLASLFKKEDIERVCKAFLRNSQIEYANGVPALMLQLFQETAALAQSTRSAWKSVFDKLEDEGDSIPSGESLRLDLKRVYKF
jgi:hypothetical protein